MALLQNQFAITTTKGTKDSGTQVVSAEFYSATPGTVVGPGEFVIISSTVAPGVTKVTLGVDATSKYYGVVLADIQKESWAIGEKLEVGILGCIVMLEASAAITAGQSLEYDPATKKVAAVVSSDTVVGIALENAAADLSLVRCLINTTF